MAFTLTLIVACITTVSCALLPLGFEWSWFKTRHNKTYVDTNEEAFRYQVWQKNRLYIETHNEAYMRGEYSYYLGENEFADMPHEEFIKFKTGHLMGKQNGTKVQESLGDVFDLPPHIDWRAKGYVTGVKNQGQCRSGWAFSTTGSVEGQEFKFTGHLISLSEQNLIDCSTTIGNHGCEGGTMGDAFDYITINDGIDTEESYPYAGKDSKCKFDRSNVGAKVLAYVGTKSGDETALQTAVANVGPLSVAIDTSHKSFQFYSSGVYNPSSCSQTRLNHGVLVVGYGAYMGEKYWLVKNSWGVSWGLEGYIMMARNRDNKCGIATRASYPLV